MSPDFNELEIQYIRSALASATNEEMAEVLERPVDEIILVINQLTDGTAMNRQTYIVNTRQQKMQALLEKRQLASKERQAALAQKKKQAIEIRKQQQIERRARKLQERLEKKHRQEEQQRFNEELKAKNEQLRKERDRIRQQNEKERKKVAVAQINHDQYRKERERKVAAQAYQTRKIDWQQCRTIKLENGTYIVVEPGQDPEEAKLRAQLAMTNNAMRMKIKDSKF